MEHHTNHKEKNPIDIRPFLVPIAIIVGAIIIGLIIALALVLTRSPQNNQAANTGNTGAATTPPAPTVAVDIKNVVTKDEPFVGNANAKVTIAYWSDYQCPFCKQFDSSTLQDIYKNYVQTGKAKVVFKDFQFLGADSQTAAIYARAIWDLYPDKYYAWREAMFNKQDGENSGFGTEDTIVTLTKTIPGIDAAKVTSATVSNKDKYQKAIDADRAEGGNMGIHGTPGFIIGTQMISGGAPYSVFSSDIDTLLK